MNEENDIQRYLKYQHQEKINPIDQQFDQFYPDKAKIVLHQKATKADEIIKRGKLIFNKSTGELHRGESFLGEIRPKKTYYYFFLCLFKNFNRSVSYEDITKYILENTGRKVAGDSYENYCHKQKSTIKKNNPKIGVLIEIYSLDSGKNGYRLSDKKRQKTGRK